MRVPDTTVLDHLEKRTNPNNTLLVLVGFSTKENILIMIIIYHITLFPHKKRLMTVLAPKQIKSLNAVGRN